MYIALSFIGSDFTPGEILPEDTDAELIRRLIRAGAVRETAPEPGSAPKAPQEAQGAAPETAEGSVPEEVQEIDEDEPVPEIDIMDGIVQDEPKPAAKKTRRKAK